MNETYLKIIQTAYALFATHGFERTSLNMIAREVGISKPSLYYYFPSKDDLLDIIFKIILEEIRFEKAYALDSLDAGQIKSALIQTGHNHIRNQLQDPHYLSIMREFSSYSVRKKQVENEFIDIVTSYQNGFERLLGRCQEQGILSSEVDIRTRSELLTTVVNGINMGLQLGIKLDYEGVWTQVIEKCFSID